MLLNRDLVLIVCCSLSLLLTGCGSSSSDSVETSQESSSSDTSQSSDDSEQSDSSSDSSSSEESDVEQDSTDTDTDTDTDSDSDSDSTSGSDESEVAEEWDISTGANSADDLTGLSFSVLNLDLDNFMVTSESQALTVTTADELISISYDGEVVVTVSQDDYGLTIQSTLQESLLEYALQGNYDQTLTFYSQENFKVSLNDVVIASADGPALNIQSKVRAFVVSPADTDNELSSSTTWTDRTLADGEEMDLKGTLFSEGPILLSGEGELLISAAKKHAICSDDHVRVSSGHYELTAEVKDGIRTNDAFIMDGGELSITTDEGKGIKVKGKEDDLTPLGFIAINDGLLEIESYDKAITASWESDEDGDTATLADDPDPRVTINGGTLTLVTTGTPYETRDDSLSPEGIEGKSIVTINGGSLNIQTTDDAINAGNQIVINEGSIYAKASQNDAIDSNGTMAIHGGVVIADGAGGAEGGLDCDNNTFAITGGTLIGFGGRNSSPTRSVTTQNTVTLRQANSGLLVIKDSSDQVAFAYQLGESAAVLLSSPELETGVSYSLYKGGTISGYGELFHGLYLNSESHSGGSSSSSFTISSTTTSL